MNKTKYNMGWRPSLPDRRNHQYRLTPYGKAETAVTYPAHALVGRMPAIYDQETIGACTGNAAIAACEHNLMATVYTNYYWLSRLFCYFNARDREGTADSDSGATLADTMWCLRHIGVCPENDWPYDTTKVLDRPNTTCYTDALKAEITLYSTLTTLEDMLACLAAGHPFVFGFTAYDSLQSNEMASSGILNLPKPSESIIGGHAVCVIGYNLAQKRFLCRNSWGTSWGLPKMPGHFTMPFAYVTDPNLSGDWWTIRQGW